MADMRIVFMGTPDFAVPTLERLLAVGPDAGWQVVGVATQPDRRAGRGKKLAMSPVKELALRHAVPLLQPASLRKQPDMVEALAAWAPDLLVVAAYGLILPKAVLAIPRFGAVNVHASLLPAYRGASPIAAAILDGLTETGVSIMLMDVGMDTGPVLAQVRQPIAATDSTALLSARLAEQGAQALVDTLPRWLAGELAPVDQADLPGVVSHCSLIEKEDGRIDWSLPAARIERMTRAYAPWPSAFTHWNGNLLKIWQATVVAGAAAPGCVVERADDVAVGTGDGLLRLEMVQPAGKRAMDAASFLRGAPDFVGSTLG